MAAILGFLTAIAPLITNFGLTLIDWFTADAQAAQQAKVNFINAIQAHLTDAMNSVNDRQSYQAQDDELNQWAEDQDKPPPPPPPKT